MKKSILFLSFLTITGSIMAQKVTTTSAVVSFDATTPKDALPKAENKTVIASFDKATGAVAFEAAVNNFAFSNPKIQEHFNGAAWMNTVSFPKFSFNGKVDKINKVKFRKDGTYKVKVTGNLTVKGISKPVSAPAIVTVSGGAISATSTFSIKLKDYGIAGAPIDGGKVAEKPTITVTASFN
ncbi:MAG: YceI family protein [Chitinophagaceae bacterium]